MSAAAAARRRSTSPPASVLAARSSGSTFPSRCWRAPASARRRACRSGSNAPTPRSTISSLTAPTSWRRGSASCSSPIRRARSPTCARASSLAAGSSSPAGARPSRTPGLILPLREAGKHAPPLPETNPEEPGPFAFASEARVRRILSEAGFADIALEPQDLELDIAAGRGPRYGGAAPR